MKKTITATLVAAATVAALSACNVDEGTNATGKTNKLGTTHAGTRTAKAPATPKYTVAQQNAIDSAESYLAMGEGFSRAGLIEQLSSNFGEGFKKRQAVFAVNHLNVDWNAQAVLSAKSYLKMGGGFSRTGLIDQLSSKAGEHFTVAEAKYAANHVGLGGTSGPKPKAETTGYTVARQNAIDSAKSYLDMGGGFSRLGLIEQLSSGAGEGFTKADAEFAVDHIKVNWNKQAVLSAKSYLQMGGMSRTELIDQLSSQAGEQFTLAQAEYAANQVGL